MARLWNNERELANLLIVWGLLWNVLIWLVITPIFISRPGAPAFYIFDLGLGTLVWVTIMAACRVPASIIFYRLRALRRPGRVITG